MKKNFLNAIVQGLSAVSLVYQPTEYPDLKMNLRYDRDAMRDDWCKIGMDFKVIISGRK
jgi:hypothetical protein